MVNGASHKQGDRQESRAYNSSFSLIAENDGMWTYVYISFPDGAVNSKEKSYYYFQVTYQWRKRDYASKNSINIIKKGCKNTKRKYVAGKRQKEINLKFMWGNRSLSMFEMRNNTDDDGILGLNWHNFGSRLWNWLHSDICFLSYWWT